MRIVWKDSFINNCKPVKYRERYIQNSSDGWVTDIPGDNNIYRTRNCALNAVDKILGEEGIKRRSKRLDSGIDIIGTKDDKRIG